MAINSPRIAAGPTKPRGHVLDQRVVTHPAAPGETYRTVVDGAAVDITVGPPTREGQIYFHPQALNGSRYALMYIGVEIDSQFVWVPAFLGDVVSSITGLPYDPIYGI